MPESIGAIKERLAELSREEWLEERKSLALDSRKGVVQLIRRTDSRFEREERARASFLERMAFETAYKKAGYEQIAGVDEVGRGPLAGPVVAAAVILPEGFYHDGLTDSKQMSKTARAVAFDAIMAQAQVAIGIVEAGTIDQVNIYQASKQAMEQAVGRLEPDALLVDAMTLDIPLPQEGLIKGDARSVSIAAASVVAKETRDRMMEGYAREFPGYGFERHAGYGTAEHLLALDSLGVTPIHRRTFKPVADRL